MKGNGLAKKNIKELKEFMAEASAALQEKEEEGRLQCRTDVTALAAKQGFTIADLFPEMGRGKAKNKGSKGEPKYHSEPDETGQRKTWTGRGKRPGWVNAWIGDGKNLEDLAI